DGGDERGFVAIEPDIEVVADDLSALPAIEQQWRAAPEFVWLGWWTYEAGTAALLGRAAPREALPGLVMRRYRAALELGPVARIHGDPAAGAGLCERLAASAGGVGESWPLGRVRALVEAEDYRARVRQAQEFIAAGETYQINLTQPFVAGWRPEWAGRPLSARAAAVYAQLRGSTPATM